MLKTVAKTALTLVTITVVFVNLVFFVKDNCFYSLRGLPQGTLDSVTDSLGKPYVVSFYKVDVGGRLGTALRAEATEMETGKTYNVYWEKGAKAPLYSWVSDYQIIINGHTIELTPNGVHYDYRVKRPDELDDNLK